MGLITREERKVYLWGEWRRERKGGREGERERDRACMAHNARVQRICEGKCGEVIIHLLCVRTQLTTPPPLLTLVSFIIPSPKHLLFQNVENFFSSFNSQ